MIIDFLELRKKLLENNLMTDEIELGLEYIYDKYNRDLISNYLFEVFIISIEIWIELNESENFPFGLIDIVNDFKEMINS